MTWRLGWRVLVLAAASGCRGPGEPAARLEIDAGDAGDASAAPSASTIAIASASTSAPAAETSPPRRAYWTARAMLRAPPHPVPAGVANVIVHVPEGFDASQKLHLVVFLHGSDQCAEQLAMNGHVVCARGSGFAGAGLIARHDDAGTQSIFIVPQLAYMAGGSPGRFAEKSYLRTFLTELLGETLVPGLGAPRTIDDVESITFIAQSAGWIATTRILESGDLDAKILGVVLLDAFFDGGVDVYARWLARETQGRPRKLVSVHAPWGNNIGNARALADRVRPLRPGRVVVDPKGALADAIRANDVTLVTWDVEHSWMSLVMLTKVVHGLALPPRAVTPTRALWPGTTAATPTPIARSQEIAGAIDGSDTLLANGARADDYAIALGAGESVVATVRGGASKTEWGKLDVFAQILSDGVEIASDDDGDGAFDSRVVFRATTAGTYVVRVSTAGQGLRRGPYRLRVD